MDRCQPKAEARRADSRASLLLLLALPVSVALSLQHASSLLVFVTACVGVLPLAGLMGDATEQIAERPGRRSAGYSTRPSGTPRS